MSFDLVECVIYDLHPVLVGIRLAVKCLTTEGKTIDTEGP